MTPELRDADRRRAVVSAAEGWRRAEAIDDAALAAIRQRFPDDRRRARPGFRLLFFLFTLTGVQGAFVFWIALFGGGLLRGSDRGLGAWLVLFAAGCAVAAETAIGRLKMRGFGIEEALAVHLVGFGTAGVALLLGGSFDAATRLGIVFVTLGGLAALVAWRWGIAASGLGAGVGLFGLLFQTPAPRLAWAVAGAVVAVVAWRAARRDDAAPAHRGRWSELFVVAVLALYATTHVWGIGSRWTLDVRTLVAWALGLPSGSRLAAWAGMVALPAALLALGLRRRDEQALALGVVLALVTGATASMELGWAEPWLRLLVDGALVTGGVLALRRLFGRYPGRTVAGFTDRPLYGEPQFARLVEAGAAVVAFTPAASTARPEGLRGEGGQFGGGGASGTF